MECVLDGLTVHYEVRGAGTPIVLLHGATLDYRHIMHDFEPLFALHPGCASTPTCPATASLRPRPQS